MYLAFDARYQQVTVLLHFQQGDILTAERGVQLPDLFVQGL